MKKTKKVNYYFGRLNLISSVKKEEKLKYIHDSLMSDIKLEKRGFLWKFVDIEQVNYKDEIYFYGVLVKYKDTVEEDVVDEETNTLKTANLTTKAIKQYIFILQSGTWIIAFNSPKREIQVFKHSFVELIEKANEDCFIDAEIQTINDEGKILSLLKNFDRITNIKVELHPSNPSNRDVWKQTDERLQKMRAQKFKEEYIGEDILIEEDDEVVGDILMASDGYGKATVEGEINNEAKMISTEKSPVKGKATKENSNKTIQQLYGLFKKIIRRFEQNES